MTTVEFIRQIIKQPSEEFAIWFDYTDRLPIYFADIVSAGVTAIKWPINNPGQISDGNEILVNSIGYVELPYRTKVRSVLTGGTPNFDYKVTCLAVTAGGNKLETDFFVRVKEI